MTFDRVALKNYAYDIGEFRKDCTERSSELKHAIRQAMRNLTPDGRSCTKAYAQQVRTSSKRDVQLIAMLDALLANISNSINRQEPAQLLLTDAAHHGIERLLYPCKRNNKGGDNDKEEP